MGKRKGRGVSKSHLARRFASDFINVQQGPNPAKVREYQDRVKSTYGPKNAMLPVLNNTFMHPIPPTLGEFVHPHPLLPLRLARKRMKELIEEFKAWEGKRHQGFTTWHWSMLTDYRDVVVKIGVSGPTWKFRRFHLVEGYYVDSMNYGSRNIAMMYYKASKVNWIEGKRFPISL